MERSEKEKRQMELNAKRAKSIGSNSEIHTASNFNLDKYKLDNSPQAQHARKWGAMKPYHLIAMEREKARKAAAEAAKNNE